MRANSAGARTLHITNAWHETSGGISTFYRALIRHASSHGRTMTLVVPGASTRVESITEQVRICHVEAQFSRLGDAGYRVMWPWGRTGRAIRDVLRAEQPDLVEISDKYGLAMLGGLLAASWIPGLRLRPVLAGVSHERMHDNMRAYFPLGPVVDWISRMYLKHYYWLMFDHHVANSEYTATELLDASKGHKVDRWLHVLPMGVDAHAFDPLNRTTAARRLLAERAGCPQYVRMLLYVGRLAAEKNLPLLVETLAFLGSDHHLTVAGDGKLREWLLSEGNRRTGGRIHWLGHVKSRTDLASVLAGADLFLHPNPAEPFGIAPLEAMAAGVPVVLPRSGGVLTYASEKNAWMCDPNGKDFARRVGEIFASGHEHTARLVAARETALAHDWSRVAERWCRLYDAVVAGVSYSSETSASC